MPGKPQVPGIRAAACDIGGSAWVKSSQLKKEVIHETTRFSEKSRSRSGSGCRHHGKCPRCAGTEKISMENE